MSNKDTQFLSRQKEIKKVVSENKGYLPYSEETGYSREHRKIILSDMRTVVQQLQALRTGSTDEAPVNISLAEYARDCWGFSLSERGTADSLIISLGLDPNRTTLDFLLNQADFQEGYRWLVPELLREAISLGLKKPPLYPNLIAAEENVSQPLVGMPFINPSDAMPSKIGEAESIPVGTVSFGQRSVNLQKIGIGLRVTDEVVRYVTLPVLSIFFGDVGVKLNMAKDSLAISTLINGDGGANTSAPVIGVDNTSNGIVYKDLLRAWIRMGILGRMPTSMLSNEAIALEVLQLDQFTKRDIMPAASPESRMINLRTPIPTTQNYDIHGAMPATNQLMLIDNSAALIKFNSDALKLESDRIVQRQISGTFVTETTGFAVMFRDARLIIDKSLAFSGNGFPAYMDAGAVQAASVLRER